MPPCHLTDPNVVVIGRSFSSVGRLLGVTLCSCYRHSRRRPGLFPPKSGQLFLINKQCQTEKRLVQITRISNIDCPEPPSVESPRAYGSENRQRLVSAERPEGYISSAVDVHDLSSHQRSGFKIHDRFRDTSYAPYPADATCLRDMKIPPPASPGLKRWPLERRRRSGALKSLQPNRS